MTASDWTIIIQGPFVSDEEIEKRIDNCRKFFPHLSIVVSTWGKKREVLKYRSALIIRDIEPDCDIIVGESWGKYFQHQCKSTLNGLEQVKSKFALKVRSDCEFENNQLLRFLLDYERSEKEFFVTNKSLRVAFPCYGVDWCVGGTTQAMKILWTKAKELGVSNNYYNNKRDKKDVRNEYLARYHPEQVLFLSQFQQWKKFGRYDETFTTFFKSLMAFESENYCIGRKNIGLNSQKYKNRIFDYFIPSFSSPGILIMRSMIMFLFTKIEFIRISFTDQKS